MLTIKWFFYSILYLIQVRRITSRENWILSRTACLVNDTYDVLKLNKRIIYNVQKGRVDFLNSYFSNVMRRPSLGLIKYILRNDIRKLFIQQKYFRLPQKNKPSLFIIDSFSELVDKQFEGNCNYKGIFNAYYSDVDGNKSDKLKCNDLLSESNIYESYLNFFKSFRNYTECPILFVFFPDTLEKRESYLSRSKVIYDSIGKIKKQISNFHTIEIPKQLVVHANNDMNPYHFGEEVYYFLAKEIEKSNLLPN